MFEDHQRSERLRSLGVHRSQAKYDLNGSDASRHGALRVNDDLTCVLEHMRSDILAIHSIFRHAILVDAIQTQDL